jgi:glycosyltransferase involved in cell wall biosynthesis
MKIVHLSTSDLQGGAARAAYRLHRALLQAGHDSLMLVRYKHSADDSVVAVDAQDTDDKVGKAAVLSGIVQKQYIDANRTDLSDTIFTLPYPGYDLSSCSLVHRADTINLHWVARYQSPVTLHRLLAAGKPVVWTLHDQWPFTGGCHYSAGCDQYRESCTDCPQLAEDPFGLPRAVLRDKLTLFQGANLSVVAPSVWLATSARSSRLFGELRVDVVSNALDTGVFTPLPKGQAKSSLGLGAGTIVILFVSQRGSDRRKGLPHIEAALQRCMENVDFRALVEQSKINVLCFGRPDLEVSKLPIPVVSLGYLERDEELRRAYSAADVFVLPSSEDNLPNTMLEAMSCATPVVAFDAGGISDAVSDGVTGKLVPRGNVGALAEAVTSLVLNPGERRALGERSRQVVEEQYALPVQAQRYVSLYEELLADRTCSERPARRGLRSQAAQTEEHDTEVQGKSSSAYLETTLGPYTQAIYEEVLLRALTAYVPNMQKDHEALVKRLNAEIRDLRLQLSEIRSSRAWRLIHPLRTVARALRRLKE